MKQVKAMYRREIILARIISSELTFRKLNCLKFPHPQVIHSLFTGSEQIHQLTVN